MADIELIPYVGTHPCEDIDTTISEVVAARGEAESLNARLTADETALGAKATAANLTAEETARAAADTKQVAAIAEIINGGGKNLIEMTETQTSITRYGVTATYDKTAGTITLTGEHVSADSTAIFEFYTGNASDTRVLPVGTYHLSGTPSGGSTGTYRAQLSPMNTVDTGDGKDFTLSSASYAAYRILVSGNCDFTGANAKVFRPMVCTKADWDISQDFVPFRPAYAETAATASTANTNANAANTALTVAVKGTALNLLSTNIAEICNSDANNLPNNAIFGIKVNYGAIANLPGYVYTLTGADAQNAGSIITFGKESLRGYGDTQIFVGKGSQTYIRVYAGAWQVWRKLTTARYKRLLGIGDSICEGWRNENMGFAGMLGVPYTNKGATGATLGYKEGKTQIYSEMDDLEGVYDAIIADGGINDYSFNVPLGDMPTSPVVSAADATALDKTTVSGGLAYLFYRMITEVPNAQRYFLITHKTKNYPYTANTAGYTQQQLHDRIVAICKMYNVKVIDVYEESLINSAYDVYVSPTAYSSDHSVTTQYHVDNDQIHPLWKGYFEGYLPIIEQALQTATVKA